MKSHENDSDDGSEFMHVCIIVVFLLIRLLYSLIHLINCLFQFIQFYSVLANLIDFTAVSSLTACCTQNCLSTQPPHSSKHKKKVKLSFSCNSVFLQAFINYLHSILKQTTAFLIIFIKKMIFTINSSTLIILISFSVIQTY